MRPRILVVHPYWDFWESSVPWDLRQDRYRLLEDAKRLLAERCTVAHACLLTANSNLTDVAEQGRDVDAVVLITSMAAPPATGMALLDRIKSLPVVVWALSRRSDTTDDFSHSDITTAGSTVGAPMIASALGRSGRPFDLVASTLEDEESITRAVQSASAAGRLRRSRLLQIGEPMPGYSSVLPPSEGLEELGLETVAISGADFATRSQEVRVDAIDAVIAEVYRTFEVGGSGVDQTGLARAAAAEVVLRDLVEQTGATAGAFNCHDDHLRPSPTFGIAPCLALGRLTTIGIPFTCTRDVLTSIAMLAVQALGHPTLYHEIEALDHARDEAVLANSGEFDLRLCTGGRPQLVPNVWFAGDPITAPCPCFGIPAGPGSLVSFVFAPGPRFVVAEGSFSGRSLPHTGTANAAFRFDAGAVGEAWSSWARAAVLHHAAATNARVAADIRMVAHHLSADFVEVQGSARSVPRTPG